MRFSVHDLRDCPIDTARDRIASIFSANRDRAIIIIGHGDSTGTIACGVNAEMIPDNDDLEILWVYACNSARKIASDLAKRGLTTLGFTTEVIVRVRSLPREIETAQNSVSEIGQVSPLDLYAQLRRGFFASARECFYRKEILDAAATNHARLSLRIFLPAQDDI